MFKEYCYEISEEFSDYGTTPSPGVCNDTNLNESPREQVGARRKGDSKWEKPVSAKICGFLRFPAKICGFLRFSATPKSLDLQSEPKISENLQKSAKMCVPGPVSPFCCLPFGAPWTRAHLQGHVLQQWANKLSPLTYHQIPWPKSPCTILSSNFALVIFQRC